MPDNALSDQITVNSRPGSVDTGDPGYPGQTFDVAALADRQYVAGQRWNFYLDQPQALPHALDDIATDFGADIYLKMLMDAQVRAVINVLKSSILEDGLKISPAVDQRSEPGYKRSTKLADAVGEMFDAMATSLDDVLWDMLDAIAVGNRVAELVFDLDSDAGGFGYSLTKIAVTPLESTAFVVDAYNTLLGFMARVPGQPFGTQQGTILYNLKDAPNFLPRSKFAVLSFRPRNGDPRGTSVLRPAYDPWWHKVQIKKSYLAYLTQFATPSLIGTTAPGAQPYQQIDATGNPVVDANGNPVMLTPEANMLAALQQFQGGSAIALPNGSSVIPVEMKGDGSAYINALEHWDRQITTAVLNQTLATMEGHHQARAAASTHKDVLDTLVKHAKRPLERMLRRDVIQTWLRLNGKESLIPFTPKLSLGAIEEEDVTARMIAVAALQNANYFTGEQLPDVDDMLGITRRSTDAEQIPTKETVQIAEQGPAVEAVGATAAPQQPTQEEVGVTQQAQDEAA